MQQNAFYWDWKWTKFWILITDKYTDILASESFNNVIRTWWPIICTNKDLYTPQLYVAHQNKIYFIGISKLGSKSLKGLAP